MVVESFAMSFIITLIMLIFIRERRFEYAKTAAILLILPGCYLLSFFLSFVLNSFIVISRNQIVLLGSIVGMVSSCLLIGLMAYHIKNRNLRLAYVLVNGIFILVIGIVMIFDTLNRTFITYL